jgi:hypothetical protein
MKISSDAIYLGIIIGISLAFLFLRRVFIIESFENMSQMCGVDMPPCAVGTRCMNGYCFPDTTPSVKKNNLPVFP